MAAVKRFLTWALVLVLVLFGLGTGLLIFFHIPSNAAGMAAKATCSAAFVAGREPDAEQLMADDVVPASPAFSLVSVEMDTAALTATGRFLGVFSRTAALTPDRGCVLDLPAAQVARPFAPKPTDPAPWPQGDGTVEAPAPLTQVVSAAMAGAGDPKAANTRGVAVVQGGELLALQQAPGFEGVALHGWSMSKTVGAMLAWDVFARAGIAWDTPVVNAFRGGREPQWAAQWRQDERARITLNDLLTMRAGLAVDEGYLPWSDTVQMLNGEPDMAGWAAEHPAQDPPGQTWEYLSAVSNILADVVRHQFADDATYWRAIQERIFDPIGATSATLETDTVGTQVASSYLWATAADWARLGQLMLQDGQWQGRRVLPPGWLARASEPAMTEGEGAGFSAQAWLPAQPVGGECRDVEGVPADTVTMEGHWGQMVAMIPSRDAVVVRLGWTIDSDQFDSCALLRDVAAALPR